MEVKANRERRVRVYTPMAELQHPSVLWHRMFTDLIASRTLAVTLARRDLQAQYRGSILGVLWVFLTPALNTLLWLILSATGLVRIAETGMPYPLYVFIGTMSWQLFVEALNAPLQQMTAAKSMLTKLDLPREAIVLAGAFKVMVNSGVKLLLLLVAVVLFGLAPDWRVIWVPFVMLLLLVAGTSIGLFLTPVGMLYADVARALPLASQLLMYLSPVLFAMPVGGVLAQIYAWNPLTPLIINTRAWLTGTEGAMLHYLVVVSIGFLVLLFIGWVLFRLGMSIIVERMGS
jgi:lipopolysaccharide transport system permease protein